MKFAAGGERSYLLTWGVANRTVVPSTAGPGPSGTHLGHQHLVAGGGSVPAGIELNIRRDSLAAGVDG